MAAAVVGLALAIGGRGTIIDAVGPGSTAGNTEVRLPGPQDVERRPAAASSSTR